MGIGGIIVLIVVVLGVFSDVASAAQNTSSSNVTLEVAEQTMVSVQPDSYHFASMTLGETNFSDIPALQLIITNDGSTNVSNIYVHMNTLQSEDNNPLGSGAAQEYAAGRFLWIKNKTSRFYQAGTLTWNKTVGKPSGITEDSSDPPAQSYGFYKNASGNYLWSLGGNATEDSLGNFDTSGSVCNETNPGDHAGVGETGHHPEMRIKNDTDDNTNRDLSSSASDTIVYQFTNGADGNPWGVHRATDGPLKGHYLAAHSSCEKVYIYRFDADSRFPSSGSTDQYLVSEVLAPGDEYSGRVGAAVPDGIPNGSTNRTRLTVTAESQ